MKFEDLKKKIGSFTISGANLPDEKVSLKRLRECAEKAKFSREQLAQIDKIEKLYLSLLEKDIEAKPLNIGKDGKVEIKEGQIFHRARANDMDDFDRFSKLGVVASEWFGKFESADEGRFCAFLNRVLNEKHPYYQMNSTARKSPQSPILARSPVQKPKITFYFDESNPVMKKLMSMDFFEYQHVKNNNPDEIPEKYIQDYIDIIETVILPQSPNSRNFHENPNMPYIAWMAIPGGIPPRLINGICINNQNKEFMDNLDEIGKMFPNAVIFDQTEQVLRRSEKELQAQKKR